MASLGSPEVISIGFLCPGSMPSSRRAVLVNGRQDGAVGQGLQAVHCGHGMFVSVSCVSAELSLSCGIAWGKMRHTRPMRTSSSGLALILWTGQVGAAALVLGTEPQAQQHVDDARR